jgi:hypothetical protein
MMKLDRYAFHARLLPALTVTVPLVLAALPWLPADAFHAKGGGGAIVKYGTSGAAGVALAYLLAQLSRGLGARLEERLWKEWGGRPSVVYLRHASREIGAKQKLDLHARIRSLNPDLHLPTPEEERLDPAEADHCYERASAWLRGATRDPKRFQLLFEDNVAYGFRRNLLALRPFAWMAAGIGIISGALAVWHGLGGAVAIGGSLIAALYAGHNSSADVRLQSDKYTRSLFDALDILSVRALGRKPRKSSTNAA